jgi:hypothetical protein
MFSPDGFFFLGIFPCSWLNPQLRDLWIERASGYLNSAVVGVPQTPLCKELSPEKQLFWLLWHTSRPQICWQKQKVQRDICLKQDSARWTASDSEFLIDPPPPLAALNSHCSIIST